MPWFIKNIILGVPVTIKMTGQDTEQTQNYDFWVLLGQYLEERMYSTIWEHKGRSLHSLVWKKDI